MSVLQVAVCSLLIASVSLSVNCESIHPIPLSDCDQSTTTHGAGCGRAIDGNTNQNFGGHSCTATEGKRSWWQARSSRLTHFKKINIYNRLDCCSERLNYFSITIDGRLEVVYRGEKFSTKSFHVNRIGQVIRIQSHKDSPLTLCEVQVYGTFVDLPTPGDRLTLHGCSQSSIVANGVCQRAMDGNVDQNYGHGSCSSTNLERGWWQGHLAKLSQVTHVRIYNRLDCCPTRLSDFAILIDGHECASHRSEPNTFFSVETFKCEGVGQSIRIVNRIPTALTLCEVQVFGSVKALPTPEKRLRLSKCSQNSITANGDCNRAIDGIRNQNYGSGSCSSTDNGRNNWWQAQLDKAAFVTQVRIYNRLDCCSDRLNDFTISVGGHECASYHSDGFFAVRTFECHQYGQIVRIESHKAAPLTLCEVEVFGTEQPK